MKKKIIFGIILLIIFAGFTYLVKTYDVAAAGPEGTAVGFSSVNVKVHELTGVNMGWYDITGLLGYASIGAAAICALAGLIQMIRRKSLLKVDRGIIALGVLFIAVMALYVCFEKVIINYRPVIMPDAAAPEASYPSSHTMLVCTVMGGIAMLIGSYDWNKGIRVLLRLLCIIMIAVMVCGRLYSGVHWFTDIIGGLILSGALLMFYSAAACTGSSTAGYRPKH